MECKEVVDELRQRGHSILVLTSSKDRGGERVIQKQDDVWRIFDYCPDNKRNELPGTNLKSIWRWFKRELEQHGLVKKALDSFAPQIIYVWATKGLSYSIAIRLAHENLPFVAHVSGYWLIDHNGAAQRRRQYVFWHWGTAHGAVGRVKALLRCMLEKRIPLDYEPLVFDNIAFTSKSIEAEHNGPAVARAKPQRIYPGIPVGRFLDLPLPNLDRPRRILFVGRLHPSKDPLTLIRACKLLQQKEETEDMSLTLVGWRHDPDYVRQLEACIDAAAKPANIRLVDPVSFEQMPAVFAEHQILVLPSLVEPFGRVAAEGAAAGLVTIISDRAGISECLADRRHALIFSAGDVMSLTDCLAQIALNSQLAQHLQREGRRLARHFFSTTRMVDEIEAFLVSSVERTTAYDQHSHRTEPGQAGPSGGSAGGPPSTSRDASI